MKNPSDTPGTNPVVEEGQNDLAKALFKTLSAPWSMAELVDDHVEVADGGAVEVWLFPVDTEYVIGDYLGALDAPTWLVADVSESDEPGGPCVFLNEDSAMVEFERRVTVSEGL